MLKTFAQTSLAVAFLILLQATASGQTISVSPSHIDLGVMEQMQEKDAEVTVTNVGNARLIIKDVQADCGCTVPTLARKELDPGESTVINVAFNSKKFHGKVIKMVNIHTNDPLNRTVDVMISAEIKTALLVDPASQRVGFTREVGGVDRVQKVTFTATEAPDLEISCDRTRLGAFELNVINDYEGDPRVSVLEVKIPADAEPGRKRDGARVRTNIKGFETVDLDIRGWVLAVLGYQPEEVNFRYKGDFGTSIRFAPSKPDLKWKITGAEIDLPEIQVEVDETVPNKETLVRLSGAPIDKTDPRAIATRGRIKGTLTVYTNLKEVPKLEIPVSYMIRM